MIVIYQFIKTNNKIILEIKIDKAYNSINGKNKVQKNSTISQYNWHNFINFQKTICFPFL